MISNIEDHPLSVFLSGWYSRVVGEGVQRKTFLGSQEKYQAHGNWEEWWEANMEKAKLLAHTFLSLFGNLDLFCDFLSVL